MMRKDLNNYAWYIIKNDYFKQSDGEDKSINSNISLYFIIWVFHIYATYVLWWKEDIKIYKSELSLSESFSVKTSQKMRMNRFDTKWFATQIRFSVDTTAFFIKHLGLI